MDALRPDGLGGPLVIVGRGRDLATGRDGTTVSIVRAATLTATLAPGDGHIVRELTTEPVRPGLAALVGQPAATGFRGRLQAADPGLRDEHDLLYQLLDDLQIVVMLSGIPHAAELHRNVSREPRVALLTSRADICAGWRTGGTIMESLASSGNTPAGIGPDAPSPRPADDPLAWHDAPPLPPRSLRRARRIDVRPAAAGGQPAASGGSAPFSRSVPAVAEPTGAPVAIDAFYRDSETLADGTETVVHEYTVTGAVDPATMTITQIAATPQVLPWVECPVAVLSAARLAGTPLAGLRTHVRRTFTGTSTCTHLNDMLRALEGVPSLLAAGPAGGTG
jgi:hypothetical protein